MIRKIVTTEIYEGASYHWEVGETMGKSGVIVEFTAGYFDNEIYGIFAYGEDKRKLCFFPMSQVIRIVAGEQDGTS